MLKLLKLFLIFVKIGAILLGGGYVILPLMISEFSDKRNLVSKDEIIDCFSLAQSLPGIVAANMSMFIGYKLCGKFGAISGMLGIIFFPFITIVILASMLDKITGNSIVQGAFWGVGIAVIALILLTVREIWQNSHKNMFFYFIFGLTLCSLIIFKFSPVQVILLMSVIGVLTKRIAGGLR